MNATHSHPRSEHSHTRTSGSARPSNGNEEATHLVSDAKALLSATANVAGAKVSEARQRLMVAVASGRQSAIAGAKATDRVIRANPYRSIAIAAGIAALAGYLLGRRGSQAK